MMTLKVALVNDYPLVVAGLRALLEPYPDRVQVGEIVMGAPVMTDVDVVLQDTFGDPHSLATDPRTVVGQPHAKLVIFSWDSSEAQVRAALAGGADAYLSKTLAPEELVEALERVHRGERVVPDGGGGDEAPVPGRWPGDGHRLSARESEVLVLICQGLSNAEISERAYLGINTVKTYIRSAYRKIGVTTRAQAVIWGMAHGFEPSGASSVARRAAPRLEVRQTYTPGGGAAVDAVSRR